LIELEMTNELLLLIRNIDSSAEVVPNAFPDTVIVSRGSILEVAKALHSHPSAYFDQLSCVTGIDNGLEAATMEVIYHLYSIPFNISLALKVVMNRDNTEVESLTSIWKTANWLERETYDMMGIRFLNHPDLRRILMPADWEGYPLRKDYKDMDTYREVKVKY
jgi:NADH-quinone oxidoreductase subunit C